MLYHGDCYEVLKDKIANDSIELVVTDPPYDLSGTGGVVCDPFMGSGTTGVACRELGREFVGCEQDKKYFELAAKAVGESVDKRERGLFGEVWE